MRKPKQKRDRKPFTARLDPAEIIALDAIADGRKLTRMGVIRLALGEFLQREGVR